MKRLLLPLLVLLALAAATAARAAAAPADLVAAKRALQDGVDASDSRTVLEARGRFDALRAADPQSAELACWVAVADWRAVALLANRDRDKKGAQRQTKAGLAAAGDAIRLDPKLALAYAVRAGLLGMSISGPMAGMTVGPKIAADEDKAAALAPRDPRVKLMAAIGTLHKPGFVGGGADKALVALKETIALYDAEAVADSTAPDWGRDDAQVWAGSAAMKLGDVAAAREHYRRALEINPRNSWVRAILLPAAEKAVAAKSDKP